VTIYIQRHQFIFFVISTSVRILELAACVCSSQNVARDKKLFRLDPGIQNVRKLRFKFKSRCYKAYHEELKFNFRQEAYVNIGV
jgi:hypothetical protein